MRFVLLPCLALVSVLASVPVAAQSVTDNLPPVVTGNEGEGAAAPAKPAAPTVETFTVADVNADVTADTAAHARDKALLQAQRTAFGQLCARLGVADPSAKMDDDALAALVQSFEVQSERVSSVRYIGVFTIRFKPAAVQKKTGASGVGSVASEAHAAVASGHIAVAVQTENLAAWAQIKRRLGAVPQVVKVDTIDLGRGVSHIDIGYSGSTDDLKQAVTAQGFVLRQGASGWELHDGSMVPR